MRLCARKSNVTFPIIYLSHEFGGKSENLEKAEKWCAFLSEQVEAMFIAPWIALCRHWQDSGGALARGLAMDLDCVRKCDALVAVQSSSYIFLSSGQQAEAGASGHVFIIPDITIERRLIYRSVSIIEDLRLFVADLGAPSNMRCQECGLVLRADRFAAGETICRSCDPLETI